MSDYARIADAIRFIASQVERQPTLDEIAAHVHLSPFHFQRLFSRWAGVTPKRYLQVLTLERAKALLHYDASITGRKGFQSSTRAGLPRFEIDSSDAQGRLRRCSWPCSG